MKVAEDLSELRDDLQMIAATIVFLNVRLGVATLVPSLFLFIMHVTTILVNAKIFHMVESLAARGWPVGRRVRPVL